MKVLQMQKMGDGKVEIIPIANMLTINKSYARLKSEDPTTVVSKIYIKRACENGEVFSRKSGTRMYVDYADLRRFLTPPKYLEDSGRRKE